jgi:hypothetical protein
MMIGTPKTGALDKAIISGVAHEGLTVTTADGRPAQLAVIDQDGNVIAAGPEVAKEVWHVAIAVIKNFWRGQGFLRVFSRPPGDERKPGEAAA